MKLLISTQSTIEFDGKYYYGNSMNAILSRYKHLSNDIVVICYVKNVDVPSNDKISDNVKYFFIEKINNIKSLLKMRYISNGKIAFEQVQNSDLCIVHLPNDNGYQVINYCKQLNKPYITVVCGCPWDVLWNYDWRGKLLAAREYFILKKVQKEAPYSIYVTQKFLQSRYPCKGKSIGCSNVNIHIGDESVLKKRIARIESVNSFKRPLKIGTVGAIDVPYKGQEYVIMALALLKRQGMFFEYHLIGRGSKDRLQNIAIKYKVEDEVIFHGAIPHDKVMDFFDNIDIYAHPSRTEGLPRSLVEAESRACLCIGSTAGGIPELLEPEYVFKSGDYSKIADLLANISIVSLKEQAYRNYNFSKEYDSSVLNSKRRNFLEEFVNDVKK